MKSLQLFEGLSKTEKRVITSAFLAVVFLILFVNYYDFSSLTNNENEIGKIEDISNNTRIKSKKKVLWQVAKKQQGIHVGDKVFTGKNSTAKIKLGKNGGFTLGENSLVEFQMVKKQKLANFQNGTYRLFSNGKLKIAMNGKIAEIDATDSEFEIVVNGTNNVQIKTIKGSGQIKIDDKVTVLPKETIQKPILLEKVIAKKEIVQVDIPPFSESYNPKLYDEYVHENNRLKKRPGQVLTVNHTVKMPIPTSSLSSTVVIQHSNATDFRSSYEHKTYGFDKKINKVFLGKNFWRYKLPDNSWSNTYSFDVDRVYQPHSKPELTSQNQQLFLIGKNVKSSFEISTPYSVMGYVVEMSNTADFSDSTQLRWQKSKAVSLQLAKSGDFFFRARSVDKDFRLSEWSNTLGIQVNTPPALEPIQLQVSRKSLRVGESVFSRWTTQPIITKHMFLVKRGNKKIIDTTLKSTSSDWYPQSPGTYQISVSAEDEYGRTVKSNTEDVLVAEPLLITKIEPVEREISSEVPEGPELVEDSPIDVSTQINITPKARNRYYTHSFLTLATSHFSLQSKAFQDANPGTVSTNMTLSLDYLYWINNHGLQAMLQKSIYSLSSATEQSDVMIGEARYRYRITPRQSYSLLKRFQLTGFLGYEFYQNNKDTFFINSYNMYKMGLTLDIPVFQRYVLSGLAAYGMQSNGTKMELGGDLFYFTKDYMGFGLGYKIHLVEFDLAEEFPSFSPYREGYAQGTFSFKYFF